MNLIFEDNSSLQFITTSLAPSIYAILETILVKGAHSIGELITSI